MNICIITSSFPVNSSDIYHKYIDELFLILLAKEHNITVLTQDRREHKEQFHKGIDVVWFPWKMSDKDSLSEMSLTNPKDIISSFSLTYNGVKSVRKICIDKKIDVFLCLWVIPSGFYVFLNNFLFKKTPFILWALGSDINKYKSNFILRHLLSSIINKSHAIFADGFELCKTVEKLSKKNCGFLPTFQKIETLNINLNNKPEKRNCFHFAFVGWLIPVKGIDILIDAFIHLKNNFNSNFLCNIVGDGDLKQSLFDKAKASGLENNIFFYGKITDNEKLVSIFRDADCLLIPSRSESIPVVLCEALQFNLPMIVTNVGDMSRIVMDNNLGYVASKPDPKIFANSIIKFMQKPVTLDKSKTEILLKELTFKYNHQALLDSINSIIK